MARPKRAAKCESVENLIQRALIDLMCEAPLEQISVGQISAKAGCSRSAFYYHYADVYDLFDRIVKSRLPVKEIGVMIATILSANVDDSFPQLVADNIIEKTIGPHREDVHELYRIIGGKESGRLIQCLKGEAVAVWSKAYEERGLVLGEDARTLFEFAFNGMLGAVAYRVSIGGENAIEDVLCLIAPEMTQAFAACLPKVNMRVNCIPELHRTPIVGQGMNCSSYRGLLR